MVCIFSSVTVIMRNIHRFLLILLVAFVGIGIIGQSTVQATGGFQVPNVDDHFDEVEKGPEPKKEEIITQQPKKEKGFWEKVGDGISSAADWVSDTASDAWETTKKAVSDAGDWISETASDLWESTKNVFSDAGDWISETASDIWDWIVDVGVTTWDWIVENKEYIGAAVTIIAGIVLCFVPGGQIIGASMLIGSGIAGGVAWFSGADGKEIAFDMFLGGLIGGASGGIGGAVTDGIRVGAAGLLSRLSPFVQKFLPVAIGGGAAGFTDSALWDKLKNGEVNWKKAAVSAGICFTLVFGAAKVGPKIINGINNIPIPTAFQKVVQTTGGEVVAAGPQTVGDTQFGQWLQKFADNTNNGGNQSTNTTATDTVEKSVYPKEAPDPIARGGGRKPPSPSEEAANKYQVVKEGEKFYVTNIEGKKVPIKVSKIEGGKKTTVIDGEKVEIEYKDDIFPIFDDHVDYTEVLDRSRWYQKDNTQFSYLGKSLAYQMGKNSNLKTEIRKTFIDTMEKGTNSSSVANPAVRIQKFFKDNPQIEATGKITKEELQAITSGKGSSSFAEKLKSDKELGELVFEAHEKWIQDTKGNTPIGYVWHHHEGLGRSAGSKDPGTMQLVPEKIHRSNTPHTGGRQSWGGSQKR